MRQLRDVHELREVMYVSNSQPLTSLDTLEQHGAIVPKKMIPALGIEMLLCFHVFPTWDLGWWYPVDWSTDPQIFASWVAICTKWTPPNDT